MAGEVVVESAVFKLIGEGASYERMMKDAEKSTKKFTEQTSSLDKIDDSITNVGKSAKSLADVFRMDKAAGSIDTLSKQWDVLSDKLGEGKELANSWGKNWSTAVSGVQFAFSGLSKAATGLKNTLASTTTVSGGMALGIKAGLIVAAAGAVVYLGKTLYDYAQGVKELDKELEKNAETQGKWRDAYRESTEAILTQSQIIPTATGKIKFLFDAWDEAEGKAEEAENKASAVRKRLETSQAATGANRLGFGTTNFVSQSLFGKSVEEIIQGSKDDVKKINKQMEEAGDDVSKQPSMWQKALAKVTPYAINFQEWVGGLWDTAENKRIKAEMDKFLEDSKAFSERAEKIGSEIADRKLRVESAVRQSLGKYQMDVLTSEMTPSQKEVFGLKEQLKFFEASAEALESLGDFDKADEVWATHKALSALFGAMKTFEGQGAAQAVQKSFKDFMKDMQESVDTIGMSGDQLRRWKLMQDDAAKGGILSPDQIEKLDEQIKRKEEAFANKKLMDEGKAMNERFLSQEDKFLNDWGHIEDLYEVGAITEGTYWKALDELEQKYYGVEKAANSAKDAVNGINASAFGSSEHIAKLMAQMDSLAYKPIVAAAEVDYKKKLGDRYRMTGPEEDEFTRRYRLMGPNIPDVAKWGREGEAERELDRLKTSMKEGNEDFTGPLGAGFYAKQGVRFGSGILDVMKNVFGITAAQKAEENALREYMKKGGEGFVGPQPPTIGSAAAGLAANALDEALSGKGVGTGRKDQAIELLKNILDAIKKNPGVAIEPADFDSDD